MKIDKIGIDLIKKFEGCSLKPYRCPAGIPTIGYGNTYYANGIRVTMKDLPITKEKADELLIDLLEDFEIGVSKQLKSKITQNQFNALVSFAYNVGLGNFKSSTLLKKVNLNPDDTTIADEFMKWNRGGGIVLNGLIARRKFESIIYYRK
mgnify:CR=1 FL=1